MTILHSELYSALLEAGAKSETASAAAEALATHQLAIERLCHEVQLAWKAFATLAALTLTATLGLMLAAGH